MRARERLPAAVALLFLGASCSSPKESTSPPAAGTARPAPTSAAAPSSAAPSSAGAAPSAAASTSAPAATAQGPSRRFSALVDSALQNGFLLEDRRGRKASVTRVGPADHWAFGAKEDASTLREVHRIELSDKEYSNVVELEEWQLDSPASARSAVDRVEGRGPDWRFFEAKLKGHHGFWIEGANVYLVYSRAIMFEPQFERMRKLARQDAPPGAAPCRHLRAVW